MTRHRRRRAVLLGACLAVALAAAACSGGDDGASSDSTVDPRRANCITVDTAVSSEKIDLLTDLATRFNDSDQATVDGECI